MFANDYIEDGKTLSLFWTVDALIACVLIGRPNVLRLSMIHLLTVAYKQTVSILGILDAVKKSPAEPMAVLIDREQRASQCASKPFCKAITNAKLAGNAVRVPPTGQGWQQAEGAFACALIDPGAYRAAVILQEALETYQSGMIPRVYVHKVGQGEQ